MDITYEQIDSFLTMLYYIIEVLFNLGMSIAAIAEGKPAPEYFSPLKEAEEEAAVTET